MHELMDLRPAGWRARIGVIVPPSNTTNETEFNRMKPDGVTFHFTRSPIHRDPAADGFQGMIKDLETAVADLVACNVDFMTYGCTAGSMACPADILIGTMENKSHKKATSTADAILEALKALGVNKIAMATPYSDATNEHEKEFLERHGLSVVKMAGLQLSGQMQKVSRIPPVQVFEHAASVDCKEAEAILICCTDFGSLDVIEKLESNLQKPVVSSNTASFWYSLRRAGISDPIDGYGTLLKNF
jgi:maleate cis-trans isomerase